MNSKRVLGLSAGILAILLLIVFGWLIQSSLERAKATDLRHHVFCEQIKPGIDRTEVRSILSQYGNFRENGSSDEVYIFFIDPNVYRQFGGKSIVLRFKNEKYIDAYVPVDFSDANKSVCR